MNYHPPLPIYSKEDTYLEQLASGWLPILEFLKDFFLLHILDPRFIIFSSLLVCGAVANKVDGVAVHLMRNNVLLTLNYTFESAVDYELTLSFPHH